MLCPSRIDHLDLRLAQGGCVLPSRNEFFKDAAHERGRFFIGNRPEAGQDGFRTCQLKCLPQSGYPLALMDTTDSRVTSAQNHEPGSAQVQAADLESR